jgi:hypothetical protein
MIAKGRSVSFDMVNGDEIDAPSSYAMLHDPTGKRWPRHSVLVAPLKQLGRQTEGNSHTEAYFGRDYLTLVGKVPSPPPKELPAWKYEGEVEMVWYTRIGLKHGGVRFKHKMNKMSLSRLLKGKGKAKLYSRGRLYRMELPRNADLDDRGYIWP